MNSTTGSEDVDVEGGLRTLLSRAVRGVTRQLWGRSGNEHARNTNEDTVYTTAQNEYITQTTIASLS